MIGGDNEERENRALVRCIILSVMVNCHSWHFQVSGQLPRAFGLASVTRG